MDIPELIDGAEPFFYPGGPVGCLLIHGFTATPNEVRPLGEYLAAQGYTVLGPRLAHHGSEPADMQRSHWQDWYLSALDGWHLLQRCCDQIVVAGTSAGGATSLLIAASHPAAAVVTLAAPIYTPHDPRLRFLRLYFRIRPFLPKPQWTEEQRASRYPVTPTLSLGQMVDYLPVVEEALPRVQAPVLLAHSRADRTVPPDSMERIYRQLGSEEKEMIWLDDAQHVLTEDEQHRDALFEKIAAFIARYTGHADGGVGGR
jgi:carboxylesterase